ncbi:MAG TPA: hypothetical protein VFK05_36205 [Polyangiaceae bacterium]|nr:hypothetical protein [Polyangiaceae bacterium]
MKLTRRVVLGALVHGGLSVARGAKAVPPNGPPTARYDLQADLEARMREAVAELGPHTQVQVVERTFVVAAPGGRRALASALDVARRALAAYFNGRFDKRPTRAISVYLFPTAAPYDAYCQKRDSTTCISPYGFYLHGDRRIVMNVGPGIGTLTHELIHPLVEADFPAAPDWLNEGIASLFEHFYFSAPGQIHGAKNWRYPRLLRALRSKQERAEASLPALFALSDQQFRGDKEDLNYALARYLCMWLDESEDLWPFYQRFRDHFLEDRSGDNSFAAVVGKTPAEANAEWTAWLLKL